MAANNPQKIMVSDKHHYVMDSRVVAAANTIRPGHLVGFSSGSAILNVTQAAAATVNLAWAIENPIIGDDLDHDYLATETCHYCHASPGALLYAWLEDTANVAKDAALEAGASGGLQAATTGKVLAYAMEAVNNSGGGSGPNAAARILVRAA